MISNQDVTYLLELMTDMGLRTQPLTPSMLIEFRETLREYTRAEVIQALRRWYEQEPREFAPNGSTLLGACRQYLPPRRNLPSANTSTERLATPALLLKQMKDARKKYPHLFDGRDLPEFPPGTSAEEIGKAMVGFLLGDRK